MQIHGTVQRLFRGENGDRFPQMQFLMATADGYEWTGDDRLRFVFPEFEGDGTCAAGAKCEKHAGCVARTLGGFPVVLNRDAQLASTHAPRETQKETHKPRVSSDEAFARMEREHLA